jgi:hypothetical protein
MEDFTMQKKLLVSALLLALMALILNFQSAFAHESITVGDYEIVYGWVNEPAIAGQLNGVEIFINNTSSGEAQPVEADMINSLVVALHYGTEIRPLTLDPVFDTPGAFDATFIPTIPGLYSLKFSGMLGDTPVDVDVELDEVQAADAFQFPSAASTNQQADSRAADWLVWLSLLFGLLGIGLGFVALQRKSH